MLVTGDQRQNMWKTPMCEKVDPDTKLMDLQSNHQENSPKTCHLPQSRTLSMSDKCYMNQHLLPAVVESHPSPLLYQLLMIHKLYSQKDQLGPDNHSDNCAGTENTNDNKDKIPQMDTIQPLDLSTKNTTDLNITSKHDTDSYQEQGIKSGKHLPQKNSEKPAGLQLLSTCSEMMDYKRTDREISDEKLHPLITRHIKDGPDIITEFISGKIKQYGKKKRKRHLTKYWELSEKEAKIQSKMSKLQNKYAKIKHKLKRLEKTKEDSLKTEYVLTDENAFMTETERDCMPGMNSIKYDNKSVNSPTYIDNEQKQPVIKDQIIMDMINDGGCSIPDPSSLTDDELVTSVPDPCTLTDDDLVSGAPVLLRKDGVYHPGSLRCIMPPDIYGVLVTRDRGNKPVILPKEELITDVIHDLRPKTVSELEVGTRVCAFWSSKIPFLHPGTVTGPDIEENFVIIELDDGDCRDIHIDQVRYIPGNSCPQKRERQAKNETKAEDCQNTSDKEYNRRMESQEDACQNQGRITQPKIPWSWADAGQKLSPKARNVYHHTIQRNSEMISVGDCAVFTSVGESSRPYIGRIDSMWQTTAWGMKVRVQWLYHKAEVIRESGEEDMKTEDDLALFSSNHYDENNVQTISHKCQVLRQGQTGDGYYIVGEYDPIHKIVIQSQL